MAGPTTVKKQMVESIQRVLDKEGPQGIYVEPLAAKLALETGFNESRVLAIFHLMKKANFITIDEGIAKKVVDAQVQ